MAEQTSKYEPLRRYLENRSDTALPLAFRDVERVLGFALPPSARRHPAWWSNNRGTNVAVKAWRDAGWRTSRVDLGAERVTFVRGEAPPDLSSRPDLVAEHSSDAIVIEHGQLRGGAIRMLEDLAEEHDCNLGDAAVRILNDMAMERRRQLVDWFRANSPRVSGDSTDVIREGRDER